VFTAAQWEQRKRLLAWTTPLETAGRVSNGRDTERPAAIAPKTATLNSIPYPEFSPYAQNGSERALVEAGRMATLSKTHIQDLRRH